MIIRGAKESELEALIDLQHLVFRPGEEGADKRYRSYVREDPTYRLDQSRLVCDKGRIVAYLRVWDRNIRVRGAVLRAGGIGSLLVHPEFRGRGYALALMEDTDQYFKDAGYDMGLLFTIIGTPFYEAQGWTPIPLPTFKIQGGPPAGPSGSGGVRDLSLEEYLPVVAGLYATATAGMTGPEVRDEAYWISGPSRYRRVFPQYGAVEDDRLVAYVNFEVGDTGVWVKEACALHGFETVYRDLAQVVVDRAGSKAIEGSLPRNHPFMQDLAEASGSTPEWGAHDEMMVKLVNWETLTEKLGGIHIPASPPESEADLWNTLLGRADVLACPPIRPWIGSLEPCDEVFYWWTDVF